MFNPQILPSDPYGVRKYTLDPMNRKKHEVYSRFLQELEGNLAVDLGCGYGVLTNIIAKGFKSVLAIDLSKPRISFCREYSRRNKNENITLLKASAYQIPFKSNSVDLVTASALISISKHAGMVPSGISKHQKREYVRCFLAETNRILKTNGIFIFDVPLILWDLWYATSNILKMRFQEVGLETNCPIHVLRAWKWKHELRNIGFHPLEIIGCHLSLLRKFPEKRNALEVLLEKRFPYIYRMMVIKSEKVKDVNQPFDPFRDK